MRLRHELAPAGWALALALGVACCTPALPSDRPLGRGPLAFNQEPAEPKRAAPEAVSASAEQSDRPASDAGAPSSSAPQPVVAALRPDAGTATTAVTAPLGGDAGSAKLDFTGEYTGRDREALRVSGGPEVMMNEDPNAKTRVRLRSDGKLDIIFVASDVGSELCKVEATPAGNVASVRPGQLCKDWKEELGALRSGHATINGKQLTVDLEFEFATNIDEGEDRIEGIWIYHFEGTRR